MFAAAIAKQAAMELLVWAHGLCFAGCQV